MIARGKGEGQGWGMGAGRVRFEKLIGNGGHKWLFLLPLNGIDLLKQVQADAEVALLPAVDRGIVGVRREKKRSEGWWR